MDNEDAHIDIEKGIGEIRKGKTEILAAIKNMRDVNQMEAKKSIKRREIHVVEDGLYHITEGIKYLQNIEEIDTIQNGIHDIREGILALNIDLLDIEKDSIDECSSNFHSGLSCIEEGLQTLIEYFG